MFIRRSRLKALEERIYDNERRIKLLLDEVIGLQPGSDFYHFYSFDPLKINSLRNTTKILLDYLGLKLEIEPASFQKIKLVNRIPRKAKLEEKQSKPKQGKQ